jgi:uncharacterized membrane protein
MIRITKVASLKNVAPQKLIDYIADVRNHPAFLSALKSVENVNGDSKKKGTSWDWTFVMAGVEVKGRAETVDYAEGKLYSFKTTSGIESVFRYSVESENGGTRLTMEVTYEVPNHVLAKVANKAIVERANDEEGKRAVENLQTIFGS